MDDGAAGKHKRDAVKTEAAHVQRRRADVLHFKKFVAAAANRTIHQLGDPQRNAQRTHGEIARRQGAPASVEHARVHDHAAVQHERSSVRINQRAGCDRARAIHTRIRSVGRIENRSACVGIDHGQGKTGGNISTQLIEHGRADVREQADGLVLIQYDRRAERKIIRGVAWIVRVAEQIVQFAQPVVIACVIGRQRIAAPARRFIHDGIGDFGDALHVNRGRHVAFGMRRVGNGIGGIGIKNAAGGQMFLQMIGEAQLKFRVVSQRVVNLRRAAGGVVRHDVSARAQQSDFGVPNHEFETRARRPLADDIPIVLRPVRVVGPVVDDHVVNQIVHVHILLQLLVLRVVCQAGIGQGQRGIPGVEVAGDQLRSIRGVSDHVIIGVVAAEITRGEIVIRPFVNVVNPPIKAVEI